MSEFDPPNILIALQKLELAKLEGIYDLFITELNYSPLESEENEQIPFDTWDLLDYDKTQLKNHIIDLRIIAGHQKFLIFMCQLDRFTKSLERKIGKKLLEDYSFCLIIFTTKEMNDWHLVNIRWDEDTKKRNYFRRLVIENFDNLHIANERLGMISLVNAKGEIRNPSVSDLMHIHDVAFDVGIIDDNFKVEFNRFFTIIKNNLLEQGKINENTAKDLTQLENVKSFSNNEYSFLNIYFCC